MTKRRKFGAVSSSGKGKAMAEEKGKRSHFRTRIGMDFDPRTTKLHSQKEVDEYMVKYDICLIPEIKVEFCPHGADVSGSAQ